MFSELNAAAMVVLSNHLGFFQLPHRARPINVWLHLAKGHPHALLMRGWKETQIKNEILKTH
jgi:hypothetical protein